MGILRRLRDKVDIHLPADALLGRDKGFDVQLTDERASAPHARLRWRRNRWYVQDLASRNGTFINGNKLDSGERKQLAKNGRIQLGSVDEEYQLIDASAPTPLARNLTTGLTVPMVDSLLTLPDAETALASIYPAKDADEGLTIDMDNRVGPAIDREVILLAGEQWQLRTQVVATKLTDVVKNAMTVESIELAVWANKNLEEITLKVVHGRRTIDVPHRAWHELLLLLAQERVRDADQPTENQGWIERDRLCQMLGRPVEQLNVAIHRARDQFRGLGVLPSADLIERRRGPRDIRIGVSRIRLEGHAALPIDSSA